MHIKQFDMQNFRAYDYAQLRLSPGLNIVIGSNAQGKTTILEGLSLFAFGRSPRAKQDKEMIRFANSETRLRLEISSQERVTEMALKISETGKQVLVNRVSKRNLSEFLGHLFVVMFTPDDLQIIKGGPEERRRFLNFAMAQSVPGLMSHLSQYGKLLQQRNRLLKMRQIEAIDVWDQQLGIAGAQIITLRREFVTFLNEHASAQYAKISDGSDDFRVEYKACCAEQSVKAIETEFYSLLKRSLQTDLQRGYSTVGPHRDDLNFFISGHPVARFASQGQQRSAILALKFAQIDHICCVAQEYPVLLLDDVLSELDPIRQEHMFSLIHKTQTILTTTHASHPISSPIAAAKVFKVSHGIITEEGT